MRATFYFNVKSIMPLDHLGEYVARRVCCLRQIIIIHCLKSNIQDAQWTILTTQKKNIKQNSHKISLMKDR